MDENGSTRPLLQATTVVMHTELDRMPSLDPGSSGDITGTSHAPTTSMILAGRGITHPSNPSLRIVGDLSRGAADRSLGVGYLWPLPIHLNTGLVDSAGKVISTKSLFGTIMDLFGVPVPADQISEHPVVPAIKLAA